MVGDDGSKFVEPEEGEGGEELPLVRDGLHTMNMLTTFLDWQATGTKGRSRSRE